MGVRGRSRTNQVVPTLAQLRASAIHRRGNGRNLQRSATNGAGAHRREAHWDRDAQTLRPICVGNRRRIQQSLRAPRSEFRQVLRLQPFLSYVLDT